MGNSTPIIVVSIFGMAAAIFLLSLFIWLYKRSRSRSEARIDPLLIEGGNPYAVSPRFASRSEASGSAFWQGNFLETTPSNLPPSLQFGTSQGNPRIPHTRSTNHGGSRTASSLTHVSDMSSFVRFFTSTPKSQSSGSTDRRRRSFVRDYVAGNLPETPTTPEKYGFSIAQPPESRTKPPKRRFVVFKPSSHSGRTTSSSSKSIRSKASQWAISFFNTHPSASAAHIPPPTNNTRTPLTPENLQAQKAPRRWVIMNPSSSRSTASTASRTTRSGKSKSNRSRLSLRKKRIENPSVGVSKVGDEQVVAPHRSRSLPAPPVHALPRKSSFRINFRPHASDPVGAISSSRKGHSSLQGPRPNIKRKDISLRIIPQ